MKVSIIMPVYGSEKYLRHAVDSVLEQDFEEFELILVDDGSPDQSGAICDQYAKENSKVVVIHKENGGICSARNAGLEIARGEYIGFCDNDDEYKPHLIRDNYELAKANDVDLMRYATINLTKKEDGKKWATVAKIDDCFLEKKEFAEHYRCVRSVDTIWSGLYRKQIIEDYHIRFDERFRYGSEDLNFNLQFLLHCEKLGFQSKAYYTWIRRETHSTSRSFRKDYVDKNYINMELEEKLLTEVCQGKVDDVVKNMFLIDSYVFPMFGGYMQVAGCDMSTHDRCKELKKMRNMPLFSHKVSNRSIYKAYTINRKNGLIMYLFFRKHNWFLLFGLKVSYRLLRSIRFR